MSQKPASIFPAIILLLAAVACNGLTSHPTGLPPVSKTPTIALKNPKPQKSSTPVIDDLLERQWAIEAFSADNEGHPEYALGAPDAADCVSQSTAWTGLSTVTGEGGSWIQLHYRTSVIPNEINILQSANPGGIIGVEVEGSGGIRAIYDAEPMIGGKCPDILSIPVNVDFAVDTILILVASSENPTHIDAVELVGRIQILSDMPVLWRIPVPGNASPGLMDVDPLGDVYLAAGLGGVYIFDWEGNMLEDFPPPQGALIADIKVDLFGNLLLADPALNQVYITTPGGERLGSFGKQGEGDGDFGQHSPLALEVSTYDNDIYILNENAHKAQIQLYDSTDFRFIHSFPLEGGSFPDMDMSDANMLYVLDQTNAVILTIDPETGQVLDRLGEKALAGTTPHGIAMDSAGNFFLSVKSSNRGAAIYMLDSQGGLEKLLGRLIDGVDAGWPEGTFYNPGGIAVTPDGRFLFVSDGMEGRVYLTAYKLIE